MSEQVLLEESVSVDVCYYCVKTLHSPIIFFDKHLVYIINLFIFAVEIVPKRFAPIFFSPYGLYYKLIYSLIHSCSAEACLAKMAFNKCVTLKIMSNGREEDY